MIAIRKKNNLLVQMITQQKKQSVRYTKWLHDWKKQSASTTNWSYDGVMIPRLKIKKKCRQSDLSWHAGLNWQVKPAILFHMYVWSGIFTCRQQYLWKNKITWAPAISTKKAKHAKDKKQNKKKGKNAKKHKKCNSWAPAISSKNTMNVSLQKKIQKSKTE